MHIDSHCRRHHHLPPAVSAYQPPQWLRGRSLLADREAKQHAFFPCVVVADAVFSSTVDLHALLPMATRLS